MLEQNETPQVTEFDHSERGHLRVMSAELAPDKLSPNILSLAETAARADTLNAYGSIARGETITPELVGVALAREQTLAIIALREEYNQSHFQLAA